MPIQRTVLNKRHQPLKRLPSQILLQRGLKKLGKKLDRLQKLLLEGSLPRHSWTPPLSTLCNKQQLQKHRKEAIDIQRQNNRLMAIPLEIRSKIYRCLLVFDEPFELAPMSSESNKSGILRSRSYQRLRTVWRTYLQPFQLSSMIWSEAVGVFFGCNEFRFSGSCGWSDAAKFLHFFKNHISSVRHLAFHIPFHGISIQRNSARGSREYCLNQYFLVQDQRFPLREGVFNWIRLQDAPKMLKAASNLKSLKLILPSDYKIYDDTLWFSDLDENSPGPQVTDTAWAILKSLPTEIKITIIRLQKQPKLDDIPMLITRRQGDDPLYHSQFLDAARRSGWPVETQFYDADGRYPVRAEGEGNDDATA
ncbi:MAG: hypothetical protein Q9157_003192 [Trypethelium eluteriae]